MCDSNACAWQRQRATISRDDIMVTFEKTRIHAISAVLFLLGLYALAGVAYAAFARSADATVAWAIVAALAFIASAFYQRYAKKKRSGAQ